MGNTVKGVEGVEGVKGESRTGNSAETDTTRIRGHSQIIRSSSVETRQSSGTAVVSNINTQSTNSANKQYNETSEETEDINEANGSRNDKEIQERNNKASDHDSDIENVKQPQQSPKHKATIDKNKRQKKFIKTPIPSKSRQNDSDNIGKVSHVEHTSKRSYSSTIRSKPTTSKLMTKRACSEPVTKVHIGDKSELGLVEKLEEKENSLFAKEIDFDKEESELEFGSSVRSISLDSRLFESQTTIETHTSIELQSTASRIYRENRCKLKRGLVDYYLSAGCTIPEFPQLSNVDEQNKSTRYWTPWMTITESYNEENEDSLEVIEHISSLDTFDRNNYEYDRNIIRFNQIFNHEGREIKNIYIVGDSGTGKTVFCRNLIHKWCIQHQSMEDPHSEDMSLSVGQYTKGKHAKYVKSRKLNHTGERSTVTDSYLRTMSNNSFSDNDELNKYEFLFYIPLFFETNHESISQIIDTQFRNILNDIQLGANGKNTRTPFLTELFEKESEKCLIVLDGLDQWRLTNNKMSKPFLPIKDPRKNYTVIVTTTQTHLEAVKMETTIDDLEVTLYGIDENTSNAMIYDLIDRLNKIFRLRRKSTEFIKEINSLKQTYFKRLPYVLQSVLYLWYHAGTIGNTLCDMFSRLLEIQVKAFNDQSIKKTNELQRNKVSAVKPGTPFRTADNIVKLPRYFINLTNCQNFKELITLLGKHALSTRNHCLSGFDSSTLEVYGFNQVEISNLIKVGILTQKQGPGFSLLRHHRYVFFPDEKMQEFLASTYLVQLFQNTTYENIGQIDLHTDKLISVLRLEFDIFSSLDKVFQFSNMISFICGLYPPTTEEITHMIIDVANKDSRIIEFRKTLDSESQDDIDTELQELVSSCAHESVSVNTHRIILYIGDISYQNFEPIYVKYVPASQVASLIIDADEEPMVSTHISKFIQETRLSNELQKLIVKDENSHLSLQDIESLHILTQRCLRTLSVLSYVFNYNTRIIYLKITQDLNNLLPQMSNLLELELKGFKLSHNEFSTLAYTLSGLTGLKRLHLFDLACELQRCDCEEHKMDFLACNKLEHVEVDGRQLPIIGINKEKLITCNIGNLPQGAEIQIFSSLRQAKRLKHFIQEVRRRPPFISQTLIKTLNTWYNLESLHLKGINFGENSLLFDAKMKLLTNIRLVETSMSRIGWSHFIDSLQELPQVVTIVTRGIVVSLIAEDITRDPLRRPVDAETRAVILDRETELEEAFNYVTGKSNMFKVLFHIDNMFDFEKRTTTT